MSSKENLEIQISSCFLRNEDIVKLLGIQINNNLNCDYHVNQLRKKASKKLSDLGRIANYMDINKQKMLMKVFLSLQFSDSPLIWMFHDRKMEHRTNTAFTREI